jgi:hypothetical protein
MFDHRKWWGILIGILVLVYYWYIGILILLGGILIDLVVVGEDLFSFPSLILLQK